VVTISTISAITGGIRRAYFVCGFDPCLECILTYT
jgi:hypothetical protein